MPEQATSTAAPTLQWRDFHPQHMPQRHFQQGQYPASALGIIQLSERQRSLRRIELIIAGCRGRLESSVAAELTQTQQLCQSAPTTMLRQHL
jgi:hypothetical protein